MSYNDYDMAEVVDVHGDEQSSTSVRLEKEEHNQQNGHKPRVRDLHQNRHDDRQEDEQKDEQKDEQEDEQGDEQHHSTELADTRTAACQRCSIRRSKCDFEIPCAPCIKAVAGDHCRSVLGLSIFLGGFFLGFFFFHFPIFFFWVGKMLAAIVFQAWWWRSAWYKMA